MKITLLNVKDLIMLPFLFATALYKFFLNSLKIISEYDEEILQSQTAVNPIAPRGRATQTITRHQEDKLSKATSSLFPIKMIVMPEWT